MASETAYEALPSGEYDPSSKPKLNDVEIPVNGQPQVYWAPVPLAPRRKWRGGCLQCCGSSSTDCKACCIATALPCVAFGHNMRMGLALAFFTQAILYFVYMSLFKTVASIGGPLQCGVPPHFPGLGDSLFMNPHHGFRHGGDDDRHASRDDDDDDDGHHHEATDLTWGAPAALQAEDADIHFDSWMVNHGHQRRARRLSDGGAATATATATASAMASSSAAGETAAAMAVPLASDQPILAAPDVLALQLANFFAQANAEISRAFAAAEADPEVQRLAQSQAEKHAGRATSQPHVTSEVVVVPSSEVEVSTDEDQFAAQEARFDLLIDELSEPYADLESSAYATSTTSSSSSSGLYTSSEALELAAQQQALVAFDACMCKWRMLECASTPLAIIFLVYAGVRRGQLRRRLGIRGSMVEDQLMWLCCAPLALCQETRTVAHYFGSGCPCRASAAACNPAAMQCQAPVAPQMAAPAAQPAEAV